MPRTFTTFIVNFNFCCDLNNLNIKITFPKSGINVYSLLGLDMSFLGKPGTACLATQL